MILDEISMIGANALWEMHIGLQVACDEGEHARAQDGADGHLASLKKTRATPRTHPNGVQGFVLKPEVVRKCWEAEKGKGGASCCGYYWLHHA